MIGSRFPYTEFLPKEGQARGVQIDIDPKMVSMRYPMEVNLIGDSAATLRKLLPLLEHKTGPVLARADREERQGMVADAGKPRDGRRQPAQPAARLLGIVAAPAGELHHRLRHRLGHQLVRARPEDPPRHDGVGVGRAGDDGAGHALCDRRQIRLSRPAGAGAGRRRRDADERHERADHGREILEAVARPAVHRAGPQQPRI